MLCNKQSMLCNFVNREYLSSTMVFILYNLGKIDDAKLYHEKALQINPNLADILEVKELADLIN